MRITSWLAACALVLACASHAGAQTAPPAQDGRVVGQTLEGRTSTPATEPPALSAAQQCDVERVALQAQVVELRARVVELQTALDRQALARERARVEHGLQLPAGWQFDWQQLRPVAASPRTAPPSSGQPQEPK